jgi:thioredoxin-dependent peroxiredoxin
MTNFAFDVPCAPRHRYHLQLLPQWALLMLEVGTRAPEFTLADQEGREVSLSTLLNRGPVILYFYPADFTPGCTRQACAIRDLYSEALRGGFTVAGISPQKSARHRAFQAQYRLPFTLLADPEKSVIKMYGVDGPLGFGVRRATFLIDPARFIRGALLADFRISQHVNFIHRALAMSAR